MGYPSDNPIQSIIRNHIVQVAKFLNEKHASSFKVFNLLVKFVLFGFFDYPFFFVEFF